ncbi:hypothetical protein ACFE04_029681 [Oxalis oulophora]
MVMVVHILLILIKLILIIAITVEAQAAVAGQLPDDEVDALKEIATQLGKTDWNFNINPCSNGSSWVTPTSTDRPLYNNTLNCNCSFPGDSQKSQLTRCLFLLNRFLKGQDLAGVLPPSLSKLPYIKSVDFTRNYINGTIPREWASTQLESMSFSANRLSGSIPAYIGNITTLKSLSFETNMFTGDIPPELGNLRNLEFLVLSANFLTGALPANLTNLSKLTELRFSSNNFSGKIPNYFQSWKQLQKLEIQASGLKGPIPSSVSVLNNLIEFRISDLVEGEASDFPDLSNMTSLKKLMLRSCNITGSIPSYIQNLPLQLLDLSFNKFEGNIPDLQGLTGTENMLLTSNSLNGTIPDWFNYRDPNIRIDLSYNNLTVGTPYTCGDNLNLFKSFSGGNLEVGNCPKATECSKVKYSLHINCGGSMIKIGKNVYEADGEYGGSTKIVAMSTYWGFSNSGFFWDRDKSESYYILNNVSTLTMPNSALYTKARVSPLSLTYYARCIGNGKYTVSLHFAEIAFRGNKSFYSLGRRFFDVYIQEKRVLKDFDIETEAKGVDKVVIRNFTTVITNRTLEIRFHWSAKGTTQVPTRGNYGPLISAISVNPKLLQRKYYSEIIIVIVIIAKVIPFSNFATDFKPPTSNNKKIKIAVGVPVGVLCLILIILGVLWWRGCFGKYSEEERELRKLDLQTGFFTYRQIKSATNNFDPMNKLGEGGFGCVYKGTLADGTIIAVKQLSSKSKQGNREFVNEIGMVSGLQHPNLVRLYGCCIEGNQLLLVYEYMENNNLARALFGTLKILASHVFHFVPALVLQQKGNLMELVDEKLESEPSKEEILRVIQMALLCTHPSPALRPTMSSVVSMLGGKTELMMDTSIYGGGDDRFKFLKDRLDQILSTPNSIETQSLINSSDVRSSDIWSTLATDVSRTTLNSV